MYIRILAIISVLSFTACESWLDVQQEGEFESGHLFSDGEGYRAVLNGLYKSMGEPCLLYTSRPSGILFVPGETVEYSFHVIMLSLQDGEDFR